MVHVFVFLGEFGFELLNWQGVVRKFARSVPSGDRIVCCSRADLSPIYEFADAYVDISEVECFKNSVASAYFAMPHRLSTWYSMQHISFDRRLKEELRRFILERLQANGQAFRDQPCSFIFSSDGVQLDGCKFGLPGYRRNLLVASSIGLYRRMEAAMSLDFALGKGLRTLLHRALPSLDYETTGGIYGALDVANNIYTKAEPDLTVLPAVRERLGWDPAEPFVLCQTRRRETRQLSRQTLPRTELGELIAALAENIRVVLLSFDTGRQFDSYSAFDDVPGCTVYHCSTFPEQSCLVHFADHCLFFTEGDFGSHIYVPPLMGKDVTAVAPRSVHELESSPIGFWNQNVFTFGGQIAPVVSEDVFASEAGIRDAVQHTLAHIRRDRKTKPVDLETSGERVDEKPMPFSRDLCVANFIQVQAERQPNAVAITAPGRAPLTYGELHKHVHEVVNAVNARGIGRNDRVAILMPPGPEMAVGFLAIAASATAAPMNPAYRPAELDTQLTDINATALLISTDLDSEAREVARARNIPILELAPTHHGPAGLFALSGDTGLPGSATGDASASDIALVLHTAGTTSRSKVVPLTHENICRSALNISASLGIAESDRCLSVMPLFHVHGLIGALLASLAAGGSTICAPEFSAPEFFQWMKSGRPTWYTAVPTMHQAILGCAPSIPEATASHTLRFIRSCSSALPPRVLQELETVFDVPVVEAYGMTEAAHEMTCNPVPPGQRKAGSVGLPTGPEVAVMGERGNLRPPGGVGEIVVKGPTVMAGYENEAETDEETFSNGWFRTGDEGYLDDDGYLFITGRLKEMINRGGEKISPRSVDEVLLEHPAVAEAVVFALPHPELGEDVAAAVVLRDGATATGAQLQGHASEQLADFKVPRQIVFLDEIPKGTTGKPMRIGLAELLGVPPPGRVEQREGPEYTAPRTPLEQKLTDIWERVLGMEQVGVHDNFFMLGGYSLQLADITYRAAQRFGVQLPPETLCETPTIAGLAERVETMLRAEPAAAHDQSGLLVRLRKGGGRPLFLVPGGGGGVQEFAIYGRLICLLGTDHPVYGLRARGLDGEQPPHGDVETMVADYVAAVRGLQPDGPYLLGGECIGGGVAFEMARQLGAQGQQVDLLVLMNAFFDGPNRDPRQTYLARQIRRVEQHTRHLRNLPAGQRPGHVARRLHNLQRRMLPLTRQQRVERYVHAVRASYQRVLTGYRPRLPYPGRLTLLATADDYREAAFRGWKDVADGGVVIDKVPGTHESYLGEHAESTAARLGRYLGGLSG